MPRLEAARGRPPWPPHLATTEDMAGAGAGASLWQRAARVRDLIRQRFIVTLFCNDSLV